MKYYCVINQLKYQESNIYYVCLIVECFMFDILKIHFEYLIYSPCLTPYNAFGMSWTMVDISKIALYVLYQRNLILFAQTHLYTLIFFKSISQYDVHLLSKSCSFNCCLWHITHHKRWNHIACGSKRLALLCTVFILFNYNQADRTVHHNLCILCAETSYNRK